MFVKNGVKIEREEWDENIPAFCPKQEGRRERERESQASLIVTAGIND